MTQKNKVIYLTTNSGYGIGEKGKYCDENSPLNPISLYGRTKCDGEDLVRDKIKNPTGIHLLTWINQKKLFNKKKEFKI